MWEKPLWVVMHTCANKEVNLCVSLYSRVCIYVCVCLCVCPCIHSYGSVCYIIYHNTWRWVVSYCQMWLSTLLINKRCVCVCVCVCLCVCVCVFVCVCLCPCTGDVLMRIVNMTTAPLLKCAIPQATLISGWHHSRSVCVCACVSVRVYAYALFENTHTTKSVRKVERERECERERPQILNKKKRVFTAFATFLSITQHTHACTIHTQQYIICLNINIPYLIMLCLLVAAELIFALHWMIWENENMAQEMDG
jgi:hypothetical protein